MVHDIYADTKTHTHVYGNMNKIIKAKETKLYYIQKGFFFIF